MSPRSLALWASVAAAVAAPAQAAIPEPALPAYTIDEALAYAGAHQPELRRALAELAARRADARVPRASWLPSIGAVVELFGSTANNSSALTLNVPEVDLPRVGGTPSRTQSTASFSPRPSTLAALSLTQEIYDFGRIAAAAAVADALAAVAEVDSRAARLDVRLAVEEAFHTVLAAKEALAATDDAHRRAVTHRELAQAGTRTGLRPPIELTRAEAEVARLEARQVRAEAGLREARAALAAAIGAEAREVDARSVEPDRSASPVFDEVLRAASKQNPAIERAIARLDAQIATTRAITHELYPNLFGSAGISGRAGGVATSSGDAPYANGWLPDVPNWHIGAVLSWNLFDGAVLARRAASQAREQAVRAELDRARLAVGYAAEQAYLELDAALRALPSLAQSVTAAKANLAQAEARFKAGLGNVVELTDAEALYTNAQLELAVGELTIARARAALAHAMGTATGRQP